VNAATLRARASFLRRTGIRTRILVGYVVLLSITTAVTIALERGLLANSSDRRVATELEQEVAEFGRLLGGSTEDGRCRAARLPDGSCDVGIDPSTGEPFGDDMASAFDTFLRRSVPGEHETMVTFVDGDFHARSSDNAPLALQEVPAFVAQVSSLTAPRRGEVDTDAGPVRYIAVPAGPSEVDAVFAVAQFLEPQLAHSREFLRIAAIANLLVLGIASWLAYLATGRLLRPVRQVTETATAISETDLSRRIVVDGDDEISKLAATFNAMLDRLEGAFDAQRRFFDDVGHELRTPITIVRGNLELLPDEPDARQRSLAIATEELDRMARLVHDLLTLARTGRPDFMRPEPVELAPLLADVRDRARTLAPRRWQVDVRRTATVDADPERLTQALVQLAANAVAHTEADDVITFGCDVNGREFGIWVRDEGCGIAEEDRSRIFDRTQRGSRARGDGSGLGLSIVAAIAESHGGEVTVRSSLGEGSTFELRLPRESADRRRADRTSPVAS
jgi:two-component system, OmpR family, sensor kinase